jgi:hypothetical protein
MEGTPADFGQLWRRYTTVTEPLLQRIRPRRLVRRVRWHPHHGVLQERIMEALAK